MRNQNLPKVSFVIPTLNASFFLPQCLEAIKTQDYPEDKIEIVIADANSTDETYNIAMSYGAKIIENPEILHEPGKARASQIASGELLFFIDADNVLTHKRWIQMMVRPYLENSGVMGFLPQTIPPPDSHSLNQYLGYLFTDPFTWFIYGKAANPKDFKFIYKPIKKTEDYVLYKFTVRQHPLFGLSQGVGTNAQFKRGAMAWSDDILAGIKLIEEGGLVAYVPAATVYHYHVDNFSHFLKKYRWRISNNLTQKVKGMGIANRGKYLNWNRRLRLMLFLPYSLSVVWPLVDSVRLSLRHRDGVMFWHLPTCFFLAMEILFNLVRYQLGMLTTTKSTYGK